MGIGDIVSGIFGSKNEEKAKGYEVDNNAYTLRGGENMAQNAQGQERANQAQQSEYQKEGKFNWDLGNGAMQQQQDARGMQMDAAGMMRARATGAVPSIATQQGNYAMGRAEAAQASAAASARGPAALALAQQQAANNTANLQGDIAGQSAIAAAQERQAAEQAYAAQSGAIRGGDQSAAQTSFGAAAQSGQLGLGAGQLALGNAQNELAVRNAQMTGAMNRESQKSANALGAQGINAGVGAQNASMNQQNALGAVNTIGTIASKLAMSDQASKVQLSPAGFVPSTWGSAQASPEATAAAAGAIDSLNGASSTMASIPQRLDDTRDQRQTSAGLGYELGQQVGTALYGGRAMGSSLPPGVAAGMASVGVKESKAGRKDEADQGKAKDAHVKAAADNAAKSKEGSGNRISQVLGSLTDESGKLAAAVDTRYHPGAGYVPPQLLSVSDENAKEPGSLENILAVNTKAPGGNPFITGGGGWDVMADAKHTSLAAAGQAPEQLVNPYNPSAGAMGITGSGASMLSDEKAKEPAPATPLGEKLRGPRDAKGEYGFAPDGSGYATLPPTRQEMMGLTFSPRYREDNSGADAHAEPTADAVSPSKIVAARLSGGSKGDEGGSSAKAAPKASAPAKSGGPRQMTPDELSRWADAELARVKRENEIRLAQPTAVHDALQRSPWAGEEAARAQDAAQAIDKGQPAADPMADAARAMRASTYAYKPGVPGTGQAPGEVNVGPMAQEMERNPITATAVKRDPRTGLLMLDESKMLKVLGGVAAHQQHQIDALAARRRKG